MSYGVFDAETIKVACDKWLTLKTGIKNRMLDSFVHEAMKNPGIVFIKTWPFIRQRTSKEVIEYLEKYSDEYRTLAKLASSNTSSIDALRDLASSGVAEIAVTARDFSMLSYFIEQK